MTEVSCVVDHDPYKNEPLFELSIVVPQTVYEWLEARAEAERDRTGHSDYVPEDVASAEVVASMEYFIEMARSDAEFVQHLTQMEVLHQDV